MKNLHYTAFVFADNLPIACQAISELLQRDDEAARRLLRDYTGLPCVDMETLRPVLVNYASRLEDVALAYPNIGRGIVLPPLRSDGSRKAVLLAGAMGVELAFDFLPVTHDMHPQYGVDVALFSSVRNLLAESFT